MTPNETQATLPAIEPQSARPPAKPDAEAPPAARDSVREVIETIVFVTVLVLLLKCFVAEAFVIPTGSMAETLLGYQRFVTCPDCGFVYPVNCSEEVDPQEGIPKPVQACTCPNCRRREVWRENGAVVKSPPGWASGDRVLVSKGLFQSYDRWNVVVFKYPDGPQKSYVPMNYIKRLVGLPGETIAIANGDLYVSDVPLDYGDQGPLPEEVERWRKPNTHPNAFAATEAFRQGRFKILRKAPEQMISVRRIVYDADRPSKQKIKIRGRDGATVEGTIPPRWTTAEPVWTLNDVAAPTEFRQTGDAMTDAFVQYRQIAVDHSLETAVGVDAFEPGFITNFTGYNTGETSHAFHPDNARWVGDLMLEATVEAPTGNGEVIFELAKGAEHFQARISLTTGVCRLVRRGVTDRELATAQTKCVGGGSHTIRFANFDERLTVWVDGKLPFGDGVEYLADRRPMPDAKNDRQPAAIGVSGTGRIVVKHLQLFRDTYYTKDPRGTANAPAGEPDATLYVQPGHYLCLGDNSTHSSDGREWGLVPERLMLGRARMVYYPFWPMGVNRIGPIR